MRVRDRQSAVPLLAALLFTGACASPGAPPPAGAPAPAPAEAPSLAATTPAVANGGHDLITAAELERVGANTLYDAVAKLRPHFLKKRTALAYGKPDATSLMLYVDGERMASVDDLRHVALYAVEEVRFYEPQIANMRFARYNNAAGAIAVRLKQIVDVQ